MADLDLHKLKNLIYMAIGTSTEHNVQTILVEAIDLIDNHEIADDVENKCEYGERCITCGNPAIYAPDPFNETMNDDHRSVWLCHSCRTDRALET